MSSILSIISKRLNLNTNQVAKTIELLESGATIPFIARYRKEATGSFDEVQIADINNAWNQLNELIKRRAFIIQTIEEQGQLTSTLKQQLENCWEEVELEDLYLPFKKKRKTKATVAKELGLEPLANLIWKQEIKDVKAEAKRFVKGEVQSYEEALQGAGDIIAERISEDTDARNLIRKLFRQKANFTAKVVKSKKEEAAKYSDYFDSEESASRAPAHRVLAMFRGEKEGLLRVKLSIDKDDAFFQLKRKYVKSWASYACREQLEAAITDAYARLLGPSIETEFRKIYKEKADEEAIRVFSENLKQLLLAPPLGNKRIMGIDPGFRTGCKVVCLDENGNLLENTTIYPHPPQIKQDEAQKTIEHLAHKYAIEAIAIGNGTAGKESYAFIKSINLGQHVEAFMVNESGASIYSASEIARKEFPDHDITVRGAVSIARRLMDPLSELVKIDPKSIGVGQYQHDVNPTKLKADLDRCVESCVNLVGINLNTASEHVLTYISGLGPTLAKNIVEYRLEHGSFESIEQLKNVPRMGEKAFEQSAGFLRIRDGKNPLDNTGVHPERYTLVKQMAKDLLTDIPSLIQNVELRKSIQPNKYINAEVGLPTIVDILEELAKPGLDIRGAAKTFEFTPGVNSIEDLRVGMMVNGIINNVTKFGAFVDIGIKATGLIHISQLADRFVKDPLDVVKLNQEVNAKVIEVDTNRKRISLSLKA